MAIQKPYILFVGLSVLHSYTCVSVYLGGWRGSDGSDHSSGVAILSAMEITGRREEDTC